MVWVQCMYLSTNKQTNKQTKCHGHSHFHPCFLGDLSDLSSYFTIPAMCQPPFVAKVLSPPALKESKLASGDGEFYAAMQLAPVPKLASVGG